MLIYISIMGCGTLLQLVALAAQDIYIIGNPQITFFKAVFKRHTNFALESLEETFTNVAGFAKAKYNDVTNQFDNTNNRRSSSVILSKRGDLLHKIYLEIDLGVDPTNSNFIATSSSYNPLTLRPGFAMIDFVELLIGGQVVDRRYGEWLDIWSQMSSSMEEYAKLERLIDCSLHSSTNVRKMYIPLDFWFTKNYGLALPVIALKYHEVKLNIQFKTGVSIMSWGDEMPASSGYGSGGSHPTRTENTIQPVIENIRVFCDYIFLDNNERKQFFNNCHEYLVEQVQRQTNINFEHIIPKANIKLKFQHPIKELFWVCQPDSFADPNQAEYAPFAYHTPAQPPNSDSGTDYIESVELLMNNIRRFQPRDGDYFRIVQAYQHHSGGFHHDSTNRPPGTDGEVSSQKGYIYIYSFSINPEEYQPSGACNFSRICTPILSLTFSAEGKRGSGTAVANNEDYNHGRKNIRIYALSYNVFKIEEGMGALLYSN